MKLSCRDDALIIQLVGCRVVVAVGGIVGDTLAVVMMATNDGNSARVRAHARFQLRVLCVWNNPAPSQMSIFSMAAILQSACRQNEHGIVNITENANRKRTLHSGYVFEVTYFVVRHCLLLLLLLSVYMEWRYASGDSSSVPLWNGSTFEFRCGCVCIIQFYNGLCQHNIPKPDSTPRGVCLQCINYMYYQQFYGSINFSLLLSCLLPFPTFKKKG